jgi:L-2,4-diaminobutyrate decarboxylase
MNSRILSSAVPSFTSEPLASNPFLAKTSSSIAAYWEAITMAGRVLMSSYLEREGAYSGASPSQLTAQIQRLDVCPEQGVGFQVAIDEVSAAVIAHSVRLANPRCIAHLHCPPLIAALGAELLISGTNASMDSWDQSAAATVLEEHVIHWLVRLFGLPDGADGVFTSGGTQSNLMGLVLARNRHLQVHVGWDVQRQGVPPVAARLRILCSEAAHFTVRQSAALLGLGEQAVVTVKTDRAQRLDLGDLDDTLQHLQCEGAEPFALVATAGTTDFGSIDPLESLAERTHTHGLWLHVDAAYGGALALSEQYRSLLAGIAHADSLTVDFHKLFYQPISCGAFLVRERQRLDSIRIHANYLNPESDDQDGVPNLVTKSLQTTRRFDALKLFVSLRTHGRRELVDIIDRTISLAQDAARLIADHPALALAAWPTINAVVFRYVPAKAKDGESADAINQRLRERLWQTGEAIIARTRVGGRIYLKFTLLNPLTSAVDIERLLQRIIELGMELEA